MGGPSTEAEVSRNTGTAIAEALASIGYHVIPMEYDPHHVVENLKAAGAEVVFIALMENMVKTVLSRACWNWPGFPIPVPESLPLPLLWIKS